jgi:hypothetical protein
MSKFVQYSHHGNIVWVEFENIGKHRDFCLCWSCKKLKPGEEDNCHIAKAVYKNCVDFKLVTPVWECPEFEWRKGESD